MISGSGRAVVPEPWSRPQPGLLLVSDIIVDRSSPAVVAVTLN
jgi:hypothetical protein